MERSTHHYVGISIQELDTFLQTPETALQAAQQEPGKFILRSCERQLSEKSILSSRFTIRTHKKSVSYFSTQWSVYQLPDSVFYTSQLINYSPEFYISEKG